MRYEGYTADVKYSEQDEALIGKVIDINDIIVFEGQSVKEITETFHKMIDEYLADCQKEGKEPAKPFTGKVMVRMPTSIHKDAYIAAKRDKVSLNTWLVRAAARELDK